MVVTGGAPDKVISRAARMKRMAASPRLTTATRVNIAPYPPAALTGASQRVAAAPKTCIRPKVHGRAGRHPDAGEKTTWAAVEPYAVRRAAVRPAGARLDSTTSAPRPSSSSRL